MNDEKKIAQAILDAQKMHKESWVVNSGYYRLDIGECLVKSCKQNNLSENLWQLLTFAFYWCNDIQDWAENVLAGTNVAGELRKP